MKHLFLSSILFLSTVLNITADIITVVPGSYTGGSASGPVSNMQAFNAIGMRTGSNSYVQFIGPSYTGTIDFQVPTSIPINSILNMSVQVNYVGPDLATQTWSWSIWDWAFNGWVPIGNNFFAFNQGPWTILQFNLYASLTNYVDPSTRTLRLQLTSNGSAGSAYINYIGVTIANDPTVTVTGPRYFVSTTGSNTGSGSISSPWRTIARATTGVSAGSTVYVRGGTYTGRIIPNVSGSPTAPITFQPYPGETVVISGTGVTAANYTGVGDGSKGLLDISNVSNLRFCGFEISSININSSTQFPAGVAIRGVADNIILSHNHIHHIANTNNNGGSNGIGVYGNTGPCSITDLIIDGNELNDCILGSSEAFTLNGNVERWTVSNNYVHDNNNIGIDAIGYEGTAPAAYDRARKGRITGNVLAANNVNANPAYPLNDNSAGGIYIDGGDHIVIERNICRLNNLGIEIASEHADTNSSYVNCRNNIIYQNTSAGLSLGGYDEDTTGGTAHCNIVNNTLYRNDSLREGNGEIALQNFTPADSGNNIIMNNIVVANGAGPDGYYVTNWTPAAAPKVTLNYNIYYTTGSAAWSWQDNWYGTFNNYKAASSQDANSLNTNPLFVTGVTNVFYLQPTSPAINAGTGLSSAVVGGRDISGHLRKAGTGIDMGAYEQ